MPEKTVYPFEVAPEQLEKDLDSYVDAICSTLSSFYLEMPRGDNYVEYSAFVVAYEQLRKATGDFQKVDLETVRPAVQKYGLVLVVLRSIVGLGPSELAHMASTLFKVSVDQGFARGIDLKARSGFPLYGKSKAEVTNRLDALISTCCSLLQRGPITSSSENIHRLDKVDTAKGLDSVQAAASKGIDYSQLLYERSLGRPFATHRDSVSELIGDKIEAAVVEELTAAEVPFHRTARAERILGFDQAPDFLIPDSASPKVVIEAKLTEDDGTARDKITRVQHLDQLSEGGKKFEVIACIDGRGFSVRRQDMKKLLLATRGKVFTLVTLPHLVKKSGLKQFIAPKGGKI
jgi:hypothetical protein